MVHERKSHRTILGRTLDDMSDVDLRGVNVLNIEEWEQKLAGLIYKCSRAIAAACFAYADPPAHEDHFVTVFPGINLRRGQLELSRYFPEAHDALNLGLHTGAVIFCAACVEESRTCRHTAALAPIYVFDRVLSEYRDVRVTQPTGSLQIGDPIQPPNGSPRGTHAWLLTDPKMTHEQYVRTLRITSGSPALEADLERHGTVSYELPPGTVHWGAELGALLDRLSISAPGNWQWPFTTDAVDRDRGTPIDVAPAELALHRALYDIWLASVFAPYQLPDIVAADGIANRLAFPGISPGFWTMLSGGTPCVEWISWKLAQTVPALRPRNQKDRELGPELGSMMALTTFSLGASSERQDAAGASVPLGHFLHDVRHFSEHVFLKLRAADDAQIAEKYYSVLGMLPVGHELRKWAGVLAHMFQDTADGAGIRPGVGRTRAPWSNLYGVAWPSNQAVKQFAFTYSAAMQFATAPKVEQMGLYRVDFEQSFADWAGACFDAAIDLFTLAIAARLQWKIGTRLAQSFETLDVFNVLARTPGLRVSGSWATHSWYALSGAAGGSVQEVIAEASSALATLFLNYLKHGLWSAGISLSVDSSAGGVGISVIGANRPCKANPIENAVERNAELADFAQELASLRRRQEGDGERMLSSLQTLRLLESASRNLRIRKGEHSAEADMYTWGFDLTW